MTAITLEGIKSRHRPVWRPEFGANHCAWCNEPMPCNVSRAMFRVEELEEKLQLATTAAQNQTKEAQRLREGLRAVLREHSSADPRRDRPGCTTCGGAGGC